MSVISSVANTIPLSQPWRACILSSSSQLDDFLRFQSRVAGEVHQVSRRETVYHTFGLEVEQVSVLEDNKRGVKEMGTEHGGSISYKVRSSFGPST
jgi:hypothetical protein